VTTMAEMTNDELLNLEFKLEFDLPMAQAELNELMGKRHLLREKLRRLLDLRFERSRPPQSAD
jgi:hypothetical protein